MYNMYINIYEVYVYLSLSIHLSIYLFICLSVYLSVIYITVCIGYQPLPTYTPPPLALKRHYHLLFFKKKLRLTPCKAEQPLPGRELQEKEAQKDYSI